MMSFCNWPVLSLPTLDDIEDKLKHFQKNELEFRTYEEKVLHSLKNIKKFKILTSSNNDKNDDEYFELEILGDYLLSYKNRDKNFEKNKSK